MVTFRPVALAHICPVRPQRTHSARRLQPFFICLGEGMRQLAGRSRENITGTTSPIGRFVGGERLGPDKQYDPSCEGT